MCKSVCDVAWTPDGYNLVAVSTDTSIVLMQFQVRVDGGGHLCEHGMLQADELGEAVPLAEQQELTRQMYGGQGVAQGQVRAHQGSTQPATCHCLPCRCLSSRRRCSNWRLVRQLLQQLLQQRPWTSTPSPVEPHWQPRLQPQRRQRHRQWRRHKKQYPKQQHLRRRRPCLDPTPRSWRRWLRAWVVGPSSKVRQRERQGKRCHAYTLQGCQGAVSPQQRRHPPGRHSQPPRPVPSRKRRPPPLRRRLGERPRSWRR